MTKAKPKYWVLRIINYGGAVTWDIYFGTSDGKEYVGEFHSRRMAVRVAKYLNKPSERSKP